MHSVYSLRLPQKKRYFTCVTESGTSVLSSNCLAVGPNISFSLRNKWTHPLRCLSINSAGHIIHFMWEVFASYNNNNNK